MMSQIHDNELNFVSFGTLDISELPVASSSSERKTFKSALLEKERLNRNYLLRIEATNTIANNSGVKGTLNNPSAESSWASLFKSNHLNNINSIPSISPTAKRNSFQKRLEQASAAVTDKRTNEIDSSDKKFTSLSVFVTEYQPDYNSTLISPRGLVNKGNMCFMNSILQPLLHCAPFYNLISSIDCLIPHDFSKTYNLLDAIIMFFKEFKIDDEFHSPSANTASTTISSASSSKNNINKEDLSSYTVYLNCDSPIIPEYVFNSVHGDENSRKFSLFRGRQEDAEEFLNFLLDTLHEEILLKLSNGASVDPKSPDNEWIEVGPKNRLSTSRNLEHLETPITRIFGGSLRSVLKRAGTKDSITIEPFNSLPLDISPKEVTNVSEALINMSKSEILEDLSKSSSRQILLDKLPPVLVFHIKRFLFTNGQAVKQLKRISIEQDLNIPEEVLSKKSVKHSYKLFAVVYHHGKNAEDGHYTCDVRRANGQWLRFDDTSVTLMQTLEFEKNGTDQSEYILFYQIIQ